MPSLNKRKAEEELHQESDEDDFNIEEKIQLILSSKSNANLICDILRYLQAEDLDEEETALACIGLEKWFTGQIANDEILKPTKVSSKVTFQNWFKKQLESFIRIIMELSKNEDFFDLSMQLLLRFYAFELDFKTKAISNVGIQKLVVTRLLSFEEDRSEEISMFEEFFIYPDFTSEFMTQAAQMLSKCTDRNELFCSNVISTLNLIGQTFPHSGIDSDICMSDNSKITASKLKSAFQSMLIAFLSKRLTENMTKKILIGFENYYLMLDSPPIMADYITRCYDSDNLSISILALHSLFKLITDYNYEYPEFYPKLYKILTDDIIYSASRIRFLHLLDLFLSSPLLPLSMQAAFTKRLARICLHSPSPVILALLPLIFNQIRRNQALRFLINSPDPKEMDSDPFDNTTDDMDKCHAMKTSLWEIETLRKHFIPEVSKMANFMAKSLGIKEQEIPIDVRYSGFLKLNEEKKEKECHLQVEKPKEFLSCELFTE